MIDMHVVREPHWLRALVEDVLTDALDPLGVIGPLGYRWWEPGNAANDFAGWQLFVFPTANEIVGPVAGDGRLEVSGFRLNVTGLLAVFTRVEAVAWHMPARYNGSLDGPELRVQGLFANKRVLLRFFSLPPADEPPSCRVNPVTGEARLRPT